MAGALFSLPLLPFLKPSKLFHSEVRSAVHVTCSSSENEVLAPSGFKAPEAKPFTVRPDKQWDIFTATLPLFFRTGTGLNVLGLELNYTQLVFNYKATLVKPEEIPSDQYALKVGENKLRETSKLGPRPEKPIEIYEFESCPYCRKVREMVSILDLDVLFYPCPQNGPNFRPKVLSLGGKMQFPYMVDPNTGVAMYESDNIIKYLADNYGDGSVPLMLSLGFITTITTIFALLPRIGKGMKYTPARLPSEPLEIWAFEASPFCKIVREVLVELELPHLLHCIARGSPKRQEFFQKNGHFQVPYLEDPNTGVKMFESPEIIEYLRATYSL